MTNGSLKNERVWRKIISVNRRLVTKSQGPAVFTVVSGNTQDATYWHDQFERKSRSLFRADGDAQVVSVCEAQPKGNFLGTFNAWSHTHRLPQSRSAVGMMSMVFGMGKRLSPFTQALGNRKAALLTPFKSTSDGEYLCTADLSTLHSNVIVSYLARNTFCGQVVKWGDEILLPGMCWEPADCRFGDVDAIRFISKIEPTEELAREKEWIVFDPSSRLMMYEYSRQPLPSLLGRLRRQEGSAIGVNLGSFAISTTFLDAGLDILGSALLDATISADWDPYVWMALFCNNEREWLAEADFERSRGARTLAALERRFPEFYSTIAKLRMSIEQRTGRPFQVGVLDFGEVFWADHGLHTTFRRSLERLTEDSESGATARELFGVTHERDRNRNIVTGSRLPVGADVRDSVIVDSIISEKAVLRNAVVVNSRIRKAVVPHGGSVLFCAADEVVFDGARAVAFRSLGRKLVLPEGGRHTTLLLQTGIEDMWGNEAIIDYSGDTYQSPILGNRSSYAEAGEFMSRIEGQALEMRWRELWSTWLC